MTRKNFKKHVFETIEKGNKGATFSIIFDIFIITLILGLLVIMVMQTTSMANQKVLTFIEFYIMIIFAGEYLLRLWTADLKYPHLAKLKAHIRYIFSFYGIIDLIVIFPFFFPLQLGFHGSPLRLIRIFRLFKLSRYFSAMDMISDVLRKKKNELIIVLITIFTLMFIASFLIFSIEHKVQPDVFRNLGSSLWWSLITLTTVGYGDIYPITTVGRILGGFLALLGIGLVALPAGIISNGFMEELHNKKEENSKKNLCNYCPHCGEKLL